VDDPNVAEFASFDHFARLPNHRIAGAVEGHRKTVSCASAQPVPTLRRSVVDKGLSQMTSIPASRNAFATEVKVVR
jgi:hypothetical protein